MSEVEPSVSQTALTNVCSQQKMTRFAAWVVTVPLQLIELFVAGCVYTFAMGYLLPRRYLPWDGQLQDASQFSILDALATAAAIVLTHACTSAPKFYFLVHAFRAEPEYLRSWMLTYARVKGRFARRTGVVGEGSSRAMPNTASRADGEA